MPLAREAPPATRFGRYVAPAGWAALVLCASLLLTARVASYLSHGWAAAWHVQYPLPFGTSHASPGARPPRNGARLLLARTFEHRVEIPNEERPLARYVQHWNFERDGVPDALPHLDVDLEGWLSVDEPIPVRIDADPPATLTVDGRPGSAEPLARGPHRVVIHWRGTLDRHVHLTLLWGTGEGVEPVPSSAVSPPRGAGRGLAAWSWGIGGLVTLLLCALAFWIASSPSPNRARRVLVAACFAVMAFGMFLRSWDHDVMPDFRENDDELFAEWDGYSLLADGTPRGWSMWANEYGPAIAREQFAYFRRPPFVVITPYFEHPPLLHVMAGAVAKLCGTHDWPHARLSETRVVPIALQGVTMLLLLAVARRFSPRGPAAFFAMLLYALIPFIALQGRVIKEEALLTPMLLGGVLSFLVWRDGGRKRRWLILSAALMAACTLAKLTGAACSVALVVLVVRERRPRDVALVVAVTIAVLAVMAAYVMKVDLAEWWFATKHQATGRAAHFNIFLRWLDDPLVNHNLVGRGWLLFLWLAAAIALTRMPRPNALVLVVPWLGYLIAISVSSGNWTFGWYAMPWYPLLCIAAGEMLARLWDEPDPLGGVLFGVLLVMYSLNFQVDPRWVMAHGSDLRPAVAAAILLLVGPFFLGVMWPGGLSRQVARAAIVLGLAAFAWCATSFVVDYDVNYVVYRNFDREVFFDR